MPTAGQKITAVSLSNPFVVQASSTSNLTVTTNTETPVPGATVTFTTSAANVPVIITGVFDISVSVAGASLAVGRCLVDAVDQPAQATTQLTTAGTRATVTQTWLATLVAAGSHTIALTADNSAAAGTAVIESPFTTITVLVLDL